MFNHQSPYHERDTETDFDYRGARFYDADVARFNSLDPLAADYPGLSDYAYVAGNPIIFIDPDGRDVIDLSDMENNPHKEDLIQDLEQKTGLTLTTDENGNLNYAKSKGNKAQVKKGENGKKTGSKLARKMLVKAIKSSRTLVIKDKTNKGSGIIPGSLKMDYDITDAQTFMNGTSSDLNKTTMGYAMVFLHELDHSGLGSSNLDPSSGHSKGAVVKKINKIRKQLGDEYGSRESYHFIQKGDAQYIPFSKDSKEVLLNKLKGIPENEYIKN